MYFWAHAEARKRLLYCSREFIYRHLIEPRVQLHVPRKESYPIPLSFFDVISATYADLEIAQENEFMTIGMSTRTAISQIRGRGSQDLRC